MTFGQGRRDPSAGVILLEMLLSLALMAAMALALAAVLGFIGRAGLRIGGADAATDLLLARHELRRWIEAAPRTADFAGSADALRFDTLIDEPPLSAADLATVSLARNGAGAVVAEIAGPGDGDPRRRTLSSAGGLRLGYFGRLTPSAAPAWHNDWPAAAEPPDLVRIDYDGPEGGLPPLTAIPALVARQSEMSLSSPLPPG